MADRTLRTHKVADLALLSDSDESLIESESHADNDFNLSTENDVEDRSDDEHRMDISDEEVCDSDASNSSLAAAWTWNNSS